MNVARFVWVAALILGTKSHILTKQDILNAVPGHIEYDPDFKKLHPNVPGPKNEAVEPHIVGGEEAFPNSRPYQGALYIPISGGTSFCGASLISPLAALTAAHCVDRRVNNVTVFFGAHTLHPETDPNVVQVSSNDVVIHEGWNRSILLNDVAIIRFHDAVPLSANITPVLLPRDASHDYLGNTTLVSGWGRPSDDSSSVSVVLREVSSHVISNYACRLAYLGTVVESHICISGDNGRGTCNGDSGGPLVINGFQVGVVSFGSSWGCEQGWPPCFARVTSYLDWIYENMASES